jgi:hypothetical protein
MTNRQSCLRNGKLINTGPATHVENVNYDVTPYGLLAPPVELLTEQINASTRVSHHAHKTKKRQNRLKNWRTAFMHWNA